MWSSASGLLWLFWPHVAWIPRLRPKLRGAPLWLVSPLSLNALDGVKRRRRRRSGSWVQVLCELSWRLG